MFWAGLESEGRGCVLANQLGKMYLYFGQIEIRNYVVLKLRFSLGISFIS